MTGDNEEKKLVGEVPLTFYKGSVEAHFRDLCSMPWDGIQLQLKTASYDRIRINRESLSVADDPENYIRSLFSMRLFRHAQELEKLALAIASGDEDVFDEDPLADYDEAREDDSSDEVHL